MTEPRDELVEDMAADAVAALLPLGNTLGKRFARAMSSEWRRNTSTALGVAEKASGLSREDFAEWVEKDPRAIPLYLKVLWAAGMNGHDETLRAMGALLGGAAVASSRGDREGFAEAELALRAMSELTSRHFRVLDVLSEGEIIGEQDGGGMYSQFTPEHVARAAEIPVETAHQCLINLTGAGLATTVSAIGGMVYPITTLGRAVVAAARAATRDEHPTDT